MIANIIVRHGIMPVEQNDIRALNYAVDSALKKIFDTNSKEIILECRLMFDLNSIDVLLKRQRYFLLAYRNLDNNLMSFNCCFVCELISV